MHKVWVAVLFMMLLASCQPEKTAIKESQRDAMIDSIVGTRMEEIARQAAEDLDRRRSIEVKAKADSIIAARNGVADTPVAQQPNPQRPPRR